MKNSNSMVILESNHIHSILKAINFLIKNPFTARKGYEALKQSDSLELPYGNAMYASYLKAKYWDNKFKNDTEPRFEDLLKANEEIERVFTLAEEKHTTPRDVKVWFRRAYLKYAIAQAHPKEHRKGKYLVLARSHVRAGLMHFGNNDSFHWLKTELYL